MLVIISVIWSFRGPKSPTNSILKIISFDLGISEKKYPCVHGRSSLETGTGLVIISIV